MSHDLSRKQFVSTLLVAAAARALPTGLPFSGDTGEVTLEDLRAAERIAGISFSDEERKKLLGEIRFAREGFEAIRKEPIDFTTEPHTVFTPLGGGSIPGAKVAAKATRIGRLD